MNARGEREKSERTVAYEYRIHFRDPEWLALHHGEVLAQVRALPSWVGETDAAHWLEATSGDAAGWPYDARIFVESASVLIELSQPSRLMRADLPALYDALASSTPIELEDCDSPGEVCDTGRLFS